MLGRTTFRALALAGAAGICGILLGPVVASASQPGEDIVVSPGSAMQHWHSEASDHLDRALRRASPTRTENKNAIVQIAFTRDANGRATDLEFVNREGGWFERSTAKRAVRSLDNLDEVPVTQSGEVYFLANIIFANDQRSHDQLKDRLAQMETARLAENSPRSKYIALGY